MNNYFVEQFYYDSGKTKANILTREEARAKGYPLDEEYKDERKLYDLWVTPCKTMKEALAWKKDTLNA